MSDPIDIFDPKHWHPANKADKKEEQKPVTEMNSKEQRAYFKQRAEDARINRYVNNLSARDRYVKTLEDQLVNLKSFVAFNKLEPQVKDYEQKIKAINDKNKKT
jgi:pyridoxine/pyridoxamine 5'-phosphate oxidase